VSFKLTWEDIEEDVRAEEVVDELGIRVTEVKGFENMASCPLPSHPGNDKNPSFSVNTDKKVYNCFGCGGGTLCDLVMQIEGFDDEQDAIAYLLKFSDYDSEDDEKFMRKILGHLGKEKPKPEPRRQSLPRFAMHVIDKWVDTPTDFYEKRRISPAVRKQLKLGYDPEHTLRGYTGAAAIIPHIFRGVLVGYQRRWDSPEDEWPAHIRKYMNTDEFPKKFTLYGYDWAIQNKSSPVFVVESALTVARLMSAGYVAVSTFGASANQHQTKLLSSFDHIVLAPDQDKVGESAMKRLFNTMDELCIVDYIPPPEEAKADIGDADDDLLADLIGQIEPAFLHFADL